MSEIWRKPNPKNVPVLEAYIEKLRNEINELHELAYLIDSPGWKKVQSIVQRKINSIELELDNFNNLDERKVVSSLQSRIDHKYFLSLVDGTDQAINSLNKKMDEAEKELAELKARL